ncbi:hypothetical protein PLANPX_3034 [Lacipirellula parvula]|uniref:Uncharacterized protein n=1 Tax=Lacipirellula parvula TaxID=2650471 RepID=A0A5K7XBU3_9BACT|nr:hypothetical protein PLANPX_3034 [Lacipirellula parvula]
MLTCARNLLLRRAVRAAVYWVISLQFPIPLLHCHGQELSFDGSPTAHVQRHHGEGDADLGHWHWHCVLPWELGQEEKDPEDRHPFPILCAGSTESVAVLDVQSEKVDIAVLPQLVLPFAVHSGSPLSLLAPASRNIGFMHSFMNVPLCALIGVSLR